MSGGEYIDDRWCSYKKLQSSVKSDTGKLVLHSRELKASSLKKNDELLVICQEERIVLIKKGNELIKKIIKADDDCDEGED